MTGVTICSGIGAPECAAPEIEWLWSADIEPFPNAVRAYHWPHVPNLGDITADDFADRALAIGRPDVLVAGTPCQAFSVAGLRRSLDDHRGNLTLRFVELVDAIQPRFVLWENVPGVLNTSDNAFGCFLGAMVGADSALVPPDGLRWTDAGVVDGPSRSAAWRILDAQYCGLAQRRERVFVIASAGDRTHPAEILFEREGVQRHTAPRREAGQRVAPTVEARVNGGGAGWGTDFMACEISDTLGVGANQTTGCKTEVVAFGMAVRRLTPTECERLQGFPDGHTAIEHRGKPVADGPRYKALGNSMAVNVMRWLLTRIQATAMTAVEAMDAMRGK